jgi:hypothetical protein
MDSNPERKLTLEGLCARCGNTFRRTFAGFSELVRFALDAQAVPVLCDVCAPSEAAD